MLGMGTETARACSIFWSPKWSLKDIQDHIKSWSEELVDPVLKLACFHFQLQVGGGRLPLSLSDCSPALFFNAPPVSPSASPATCCTGSCWILTSKLIINTTSMLVALEPGTITALICEYSWLTSFALLHCSSRH